MKRIKVYIHTCKVNLDKKNGVLIHSYLEARKKVIGKQYRPKPDATLCGILSGSTLFANRIFHQK